jgi:hypothetical protein
VGPLAAVSSYQVSRKPLAICSQKLLGKQKHGRDDTTRWLIPEILQTSVSYFHFLGNLGVVGVGLVLISLELHVTVKIFVGRKDFVAN